MAEGEGFEPPVPFRVQWFSRPPPSTTRPSLRGGTSARHSSGFAVPSRIAVSGTCLTQQVALGGVEATRRPAQPYRPRVWPGQHPPAEDSRRQSVLNVLSLVTRSSDPLSIQGHGHGPEQTAPGLDSGRTNALCPPERGVTMYSHVLQPGAEARRVIATPGVRLLNSKPLP